jgi:hypothetical protein
MSDTPDFKKLAAKVARRAEEATGEEAECLISISEYWVKLAQIEEWEHDGCPVGQVYVRDPH